MVLLGNFGYRLVQWSSDVMREGVERRVSFNDDAMLGTVFEQLLIFAVDLRCAMSDWYRVNIDRIAHVRVKLVTTSA